MPDDDLDGVWKALSDNTRRSILDLLRQGPRTTTEIVEAFPHLTRFGVMKHIEVLREAGLIHTREERRQRINSLNVVPIRQIYERWVGRFEELWSSHLLRIKEDAEAEAAKPGRRPRHARSAPNRANRQSRTDYRGDVCPCATKQKGESNDCNANSPQSGIERRMAQGAPGAPGRRKGTHPQTRRTEPAAPRTAVGTRSRRITSSKAQTARRRWPISSPAAAS